MFPDPEVHPLPSDLLDPTKNGGSTLLYYTGLTRLAKNILERVVGARIGVRERLVAAQAARREVWLIAEPLCRGRDVSRDARADVLSPVQRA